jgi:hypothetical protein
LGFDSRVAILPSKQIPGVFPDKLATPGGKFSDQQIPEIQVLIVSIGVGGNQKPLLITGSIYDFEARQTTGRQLNRSSSAA